MLNVDKLLEFLQECNNTFQSSEEGLRGSLLNLDKYSYMVSVSGTVWEETYHIKELHLDLGSMTPIEIYVDLDYFLADDYVVDDIVSFGESTVSRILSKDLQRVGFDLLAAEDVASLLIGYNVRYIVVSNDNRAKHMKSKYFDSYYTYPSEYSEGEMSIEILDFNIDISGGMHTFANEYAVEMNYLRHFSNCEISCADVYLTYQDYEWAKKVGIKFDSNNYTIGIVDCGIEAENQLISIYKYNANSDYNLQVVFILINNTIDDFYNWFNEVIKRLKSLNVYRRLTLKGIMSEEKAEQFISESYYMLGSVKNLSEEVICIDRVDIENIESYFILQGDG